MTVADARLILPEDGIEPVRQGKGDLRRELGKQCTDAQLVNRVDGREEQAHADGLRFPFAKSQDYLRRLLFIQVPDDVAVVGDPFRDLERERARDVRLRVLLKRVERLLFAAFPVEKYLRVPPGGEERGPGHRPSDHGIDRPRCTVDQHLAASQQLFPAGREMPGGRIQHIEQPQDGVVGRSRRFELMQLPCIVLHSEIGERPSSVYRKPHRHSHALGCCCRSRPAFGSAGPDRFPGGAVAVRRHVGNARSPTARDAQSRASVTGLRLSLFDLFLWH